MKDLDLGYNLVRTHDGKGAFVIVDHDEIDPVASRAPMSTVYASGRPPTHLNAHSVRSTCCLFWASLVFTSRLMCLPAG